MKKQVYFIPHGGGPLPVMGHEGHKGVIALMQGLQNEVADARAVVVITAHWEAEVASFSNASRPSMLFDYYNFPPETYEYEYSAPGAPELAHKAADLVRSVGLQSHMDEDRGFDHGTFIPMMLIRPQADIPILQMSVLASLDPAAHITLGQAVAPLLEEGVIFIGSGLSFHNLKAMRGSAAGDGKDRQFDSWLNDTLLGEGFAETERASRLANWDKAPGARFCHPREDHLMPLLVCYGIASAAGLSGKSIYREELMGYMNSGFRWSNG